MSSCEGHIHCHCMIRSNAVGSCFRTAFANLLLRRKENAHLTGQLRILQLLQRAENCCNAASVIHGACGDPVALQKLHGRIKGDTVTRCDDLLQFCLTIASIHQQICNILHLFSAAAETLRYGGDHARNGPFSVKQHILCRRQAHINTPHISHTDKSFLCNSSDNNANLIQVCIQKNMRCILSGAILSWVAIVTELSSSIILYNNKSITLTMSTYVAITRGN